MLQKGEVKEDRETAGGLTMNQYIITEELLQEAMENTTWGRTNQQKFRDKLTPYQSERDKALDIGEILESLCKTDLYWYIKGVTEGEDVGKCRGKDCNYCGRYNEKLR